MRQGQWKLLKKKMRRRKKAPGEDAGPEFNVMLFDLSRDLGEEHNLAGEHPELVADLSRRMQELDAEIEKTARAPWQKQ